jgi:serine protease AprX
VTAILTDARRGRGVIGDAAVACAVCGTPTAPDELAEAGWASAETAERLAERRTGWRRSDGACAACVQDALLSLLREKGERVLSRVIQDVWPIDAEAAFGALPTPLRLRADPRFTGRGITIAMVDAGFYPHADLVQPVNRIRAVVDAGTGHVRVHRFAPDATPQWPGWSDDDGSRWHGLMTSAAAAGNGFASRGLYRALAPDVNLVLVSAREATGRITSDSIAHALRWLLAHHHQFDVRIASISLGGDPAAMLQSNAVDTLVTQLVDAGIVVIVAAGNDGTRGIVPPATAPAAITVGGLDDRNVFDGDARRLWHSSYGTTWMGREKPELVAPSIWVAAPLLPMTGVAREARTLFARCASGDASCEPRIAELKLVTPHNQHVEGTSFAAPIVSSVVACMLEANPTLAPRRVHELLILACQRVDGAPSERQGAGAIDAGSAVALALDDEPGIAYPAVATASLGVPLRFVLRDPDARSVQLTGSWDGWMGATRGHRIAPALWRLAAPPLSSGGYEYKFVVDDRRWIDDPSNRRHRSDGFGGMNSVFDVV